MASVQADLGNSDMAKRMSSRTLEADGELDPAVPKRREADPICPH